MVISTKSYVTLEETLMIPNDFENGNNILGVSLII